MNENENSQRKTKSSFTTGAIALTFLCIGYQTAIFFHKAAIAKIVSDKSCPDTVFVYVEPKEGASPHRRVETAPKRSSAPAVVGKIAKAYTEKKCESFRFNPNEVSTSDLVRLGFSEKQALAIEHFRAKGGRFYRKADFAKSFVVADSVFRRLEPFIDIPLVDINSADSAAFDALPGIGGYFASKMVEYREALGGYSKKEQLLEIYHFDKNKYDGLSDLVTVGPHKRFPLWSESEEVLRKHPHIDKNAAHGIVLFRNNNPKAALSVENLVKAGILNRETGSKLSLCDIEDP